MINLKTKGRIRKLENLMGGNLVSKDDAPVLTPDATVDQYDASIYGTLAWHKAQIGTDRKTIKILRGTYKLLTSLILPENIYLDLDNGALIKPASGASLTVYSPEHIIAGQRQQIIDITNNSTNPLAFTKKGTVYPGWWGAVADGVTDDEPEANLALATECSVFFPPGNYYMGDYLNLYSDTEVWGVKGSTVLYQYGNYLWKQGDTDLSNVLFHDFSFHFKQAAPYSAYDCAFSLGAHRQSRFENLYFYLYNNQTIIERKIPAGATINGVDNVYRNWDVVACRHLDIAIGLDGYYYNFTGDNITTTIDTGVAWPEEFNSSVVVVEENSVRRFNQLDLTTDYSVSYAGSVLTVEMVEAPASGKRIHIWPAQPSLGGTYHMYSNNLWENIRVNYLYGGGHTAVRWLDAETYKFERLTAAGDDVVLYTTNPLDDRSSKSGGFLTWNDCVFSYYPAAAAIATLIGIELGPAAFGAVGIAMRMDQGWVTGGVNRAIVIWDTLDVLATGTVATNAASTIVTGTLTKFQDEFTLIGAINDSIIINGNMRQIASIDSDTQITLTLNAAETAGELTIYRRNYQNRSSYDFQFGVSGADNDNTNSYQSAHYVQNSISKQSGTATVLNGQAAIEVAHTLSRTPIVGEIIVVPHTDIGDLSFFISDLDADSFQINTSAAVGGDTIFGWKAELMKLN